MTRAELSRRTPWRSFGRLTEFEPFNDDVTMYAMPRIERASLMTLETYARERPQFARRSLRQEGRTVHLGEHVTLVFEDELTIRYQVQEMLRIERIFEEEVSARNSLLTNPLVPDGRNLKATMMIEYPDPEERAKRLAELIGIEDKCGSKRPATSGSGRLPTRIST